MFTGQKIKIQLLIKINLIVSQSLFDFKIFKMYLYIIITISKNQFSFVPCFSHIDLYIESLEISSR